MKKEIATQLKAAGFPQYGKGDYNEDHTYLPTLDELIYRTPQFHGLFMNDDGKFVAKNKDVEATGDTPREAVANLHLKYFNHGKN